MNELIKKLAREAYAKDALELNPRWEPNEWSEMFWKDMECCFEIFAKLIVKECASVARNADLEDVTGGDSDVLRAAANQIEQHFGVEE